MEQYNIQNIYPLYEYVPAHKIKDKFELNEQKLRT